MAVLLSSLVFQDLEQKFSQQEHDAVIVKNMKTELARFPKMERELRQLREENAYYRWKKASVVEGLPSVLLQLLQLHYVHFQTLLSELPGLQCGMWYFHMGNVKRKLKYLM